MKLLIDRFRDYYPKDIKEAKEIQNEVSSLVQLKPYNDKFKLIGGIDTAYKDDKVISAICVIDSESHKIVEKVYGIIKKGFPYVPTFLAFREVPAIIRAFDNLTGIPDIFLVDGHGICHPRGVGIATHIGVLMGIPTIGVAKSRLVGDFVMPDYKKGKYEPIIFNNNTVGYIFRSRDNVKPIFISPGHLTDLRCIIRIVEKSLGRYRIPDPLRYAHIFAEEMKKEV